MPNALINETSPYLLQHANNPVNWYAWKPEIFEKAKTENKLVLVSIGYSTCHWCHVMERECFENEIIANLMNEWFVCIKVDREERPDVDMLYMQAVQLMGQNGGWPLNCFCLPDGRPVYGGTYFRPQQWISLLNSLKDLYLNEKERMLEYAEKLHIGIKQLSILPKMDTPRMDSQKFYSIISDWIDNCDHEYGGPNYAPKFPMPVNLNFLLTVGINLGNAKILDYVQLTLNKMAQGGIYDQIGGGFCRYSVDGYWKIPHFEKMLYDNAQLIELYSKAYNYFRNFEYKHLVEQTINFLENELKSAEGLYYSALDADSEGVEGKFYVWTQEELKSVLSEKDYKLFNLIYNQDDCGYWEHNNYVLFRKNSYKYYADKLNLPLTELITQLNKIVSQLLVHRNKRIRPSLDNKCLLSWNAMLVSGFVAAYQSFLDENYLTKAIELFSRIENYFEDEHVIFRVFTLKKRSIECFLEDYAFYIKAALDLFLCTGCENYLQKAKELQLKCNEKFYDTKSELYFFAPINQTELINNKAETSDNVIASGNSVMAYNNLILYILTGKAFYNEIHKKIVDRIINLFEEAPQAYANTGLLYYYQLHGLKEVVICGPEAKEWYKKLLPYCFGNYLVTFSTNESSEIIFKDRFKPNQTLVYICINHTCQQPISNITEAIKALRLS